VVDPSGDAVGEQAAQRAVHRRVRLAEDDRKRQRVGERHAGERIEQLPFGESHGTTPLSCPATSRRWSPRHPHSAGPPQGA